MTIIEEIGPATRMVTIRGAKAVYYAVEHLDLDVLGHPEWIVVWSHTVPFRRDRAHQTGGYAFAEAARQQKDEAVVKASENVPLGGEA